MSTSQRSSVAGLFQHGKPGVPQLPPNGLVIYGNGLVFGGNVYPVLVDGVPMNLPAAAQKTAAMQNFGMQLLRQQQKPGIHHEQYQRGFQQPLDASFRQSTLQNLPRQLQQQQQMPRQQQHQLRQLRLPQLPQQQQWHNNYSNIRSIDSRVGSDIEMIHSPQMYDYIHDYGYVPTGHDLSGWNGYASCQPVDASKPFAFGWSPTD